MSYPELTPISNSSKAILTSTGSHSAVNAACPLKLYSETSSPLYSTDFITGAVEQVTYTYRKLGGDTLDLEILPETVYSAFEDAVIEYSYISNLYTAKNYLSTALGQQTASFDHRGEYKSGSLSSSLGGKNAALIFPRFNYSYQRKVGLLAASAATLNGDRPVYSASFDLADGVQDYNLQSIISSSAASGGVDYSSLGDKRITIKRVFYKSPLAMLRFFGFFQGGRMGGSSTYGQWANDSTFTVVPTWQNKLQAQAYEDAFHVRVSHFSYELKNNKIRIFPMPDMWSRTKMWIEFGYDEDSWTSSDGDSSDSGLNGVNGLSNIPYSNLPYTSINSIGKQWIRKFALASTLETLGMNRDKFKTIPIPGESVTLNGSDLISRAKEEKQELKEELKKILEDLTPEKMTETDKNIAENVQGVFSKVPMTFFVG